MNGASGNSGMRREADTFGEHGGVCKSGVKWRFEGSSLTIVIDWGQVMSSLLLCSKAGNILHR